MVDNHLTATIDLRVPPDEQVRVDIQDIKPVATMDASEITAAHMTMDELRGSDG